MQQAGALPYRHKSDGTVEVLLVTSRGSRSWIFPKGHIERGETAAMAAAKEAEEEAGIYGDLHDQSVGSYTAYRRGFFGFVRRYEVVVFPLLFVGYLPMWPEAGLRERRWASIREASSLVTNEGIRAVLSLFDTQIGQR